MQYLELINENSNWIKLIVLILRRIHVDLLFGKLDSLHTVCETRVQCNCSYGYCEDKALESRFERCSVLMCACQRRVRFWVSLTVMQQVS